MTLDLAALVLRIAAGSIFVAQGYRKLFGPADAPHGRAGLADMIRRAGMPSPDRLATAVAAIELVGGMALVLGLLTRLALIPLSIVLLVAIVGFKWRNGFLGGWDWPFSVLAITAALFVLGAGAWSLDAVFGVPI